MVVRDIRRLQSRYAENAMIPRYRSSLSWTKISTVPMYNYMNGE
jgi:hypothetical protein